MSPQTPTVAYDENHGRDDESEDQNPDSKGRCETQLSIWCRRGVGSGRCCCCCRRRRRRLRSVASPLRAHDIPQFLMLKKASVLNEWFLSD